MDPTKPAPANRGPVRPDPEKPVRKDVARNRERLIRAADELMAERGLDIALDDIARQAGLGVGTVYRHFDSKQQILQALYDQRIGQVAEIMTEALDAEDAYEAFRDCIIAIGTLQAGDRGAWQALNAADVDLRTAARERIGPLARRLVERAKATGRLRPEFDETDLPMILWMIGAIRQYTAAMDPDVWRRYLQVLLDGFAAGGEPRRPLVVPAISPDRFTNGGKLG